MKTGKYAKRGVATKALVMILAVMMIVGATIGGTLAWLAASATPVVNTFTVGDINITLQEDKLNEDGSLDTTTAVQENKYTFVPGDTLNKRPYVTVLKDSEACYLFVQVVEANNTVTNLDGKVISWSVDSGWTKLTGVDGVDNVWYKELEATTADTSYDILADDKVTVNTGITKSMVATINAADTMPTLTFNAYAVQKDNVADAAAAWAIATAN